MATGQIEGIVSGLDTSSIVSSIMEYERRNVNLMEEDKLSKTKRMSVYNAISAKLVALKTKAALLKRTSVFDAASVTVSDESFLTATVKGRVIEGQYTLSVDQLALAHQVASQGFASASESIGTGTVTIQVGNGSSKQITIDATNNTLTGLKNAINSAGAGLRAAIINDGSSSNPYRLLLTAEETGSENQIRFSSSLTGGTAPDFENSSFDSPETISWNSASTSTISLGTGASYTGNSNKTYTFTIEGSGVKTIGTDEITVNWSDGEESGSIQIPSDYVAGTEIALTGDGADGLTLAFSQGTLRGGDAFKVQTFAPLLQAAQDAKVSLGNSSGGGSPIVVTSADNTIDDVIPGLSLNLKKISDSNTPHITINTAIDVSSIEDNINAFIAAYNDVQKAIDEQFKYNADTQESGVLFGDTTLLTIQSRLRAGLLIRLDDVEGDYRLLSQLGIRHNSQGDLQAMDPTSLSEAIRNNLDDLVKFFTNTGNSSNSKISYNGATSATNMPDSGFTIRITHAATHGYLKGKAINSPETNPLLINEQNYKLKFRVDGVVSNEIALTQKTYNSWSELVAELQEKIDSDEKIGGKDVSVQYIDLGETGYLQLNSATYGRSSKVEIQAGIEDSAFVTLGLATGEVIIGDDVAGTINGEQAEGNGQMLTGVEGNQYSEGLSLKVELTSSDLASGAVEATLTLVKGFATHMDELIDMYSAAGEGVLANRVDALQQQINTIDSRVEREEARLKIREANLYKQYYALEQSLAQWNATASFLESQITQISNNWKLIGNRSGN